MIAWSYGGQAGVRFGRRVVVAGPDDCWLWKLKPNEKGYGRFTIGYKTMMAHHASYLLAFGSVPNGLCVLHQCDNPPCVNPAHLFVGTRADNNVDMRAKGRGVNPPVGINGGTWTSETVRGRNHPRAKLAQAELDDLIERARSGETTRALAARFGLTVRHTNKLRADAGLSRGRVNQHA